MNLGRANYTDTYEHAFDDKGRITVPSEWRQANFETTLHVLPPLILTERCLKIYPSAWLSRAQEKLQDRRMDDPELLGMQALAGMMQSVSFDTQGRIMIKKSMRESAGLGRDVLLFGRANHFQIWDEKVWRTAPKPNLTPGEAVRMAGL